MLNSGKLFIERIGQQGLTYLSYLPGHACFFRSAEVFHKVAKWNPTMYNTGDDLMPGRIGTVFFFPEPSFEILKDKPAGWGALTDYGRWAQFFK
jgi:hypothetical protein